MLNKLNAQINIQSIILLRAKLNLVLFGLSKGFISHSRIRHYQVSCLHKGEKVEPNSKLKKKDYLFIWNMACILPAAYTRNITRGIKFSHDLSPNFSHPVEPQMPFGYGGNQGAIGESRALPRTCRRTSFFRRRRFLWFLTIKLTFITFASKIQYFVVD